MGGAIEVLLPKAETISLDALTQRVTALEAMASRRPFDAEALSFCEHLSAAIQANDEARHRPELEAFAFWIRHQAILRLQRHLGVVTPEGVVRVAKGLLFHLPPGNVAMLFAYCWILSLLAGNRNIVRLSVQRPDHIGLLLRLIDEAFDRTPGLRREQLFLAYGHDDTVTATLSSVCDMRVLWGGDETVRRLRMIALAPLASELAFGDRFSMAAFKADVVLALSDDALADLAQHLFNDVFWFDQMGCSSPRLFLWVGCPEQSATAGRRLYTSLAEVAGAKGYAIDAGTLSAKLSYCYRALLDWPVTALRVFGGRLAVLTLDRFFDLREDVFGAGTVFECCLSDLAALADMVRRKDQTLTHFGFVPEELSRLVERLGGRGFDRLVPVGQALAFDNVWDGYDLLSAFSRQVVLRCSD
jgi:hypothetical protein